MYEYNKVLNGISKYIDIEIINNIDGWKKWTLGAIAGVILSKSTSIFNSIKENKIVKDLGLIDDNNMINIDELYKEFRKQAEKSSITFSVPMIGLLTLNVEDVDKLYAYIKE